MLTNCTTSQLPRAHDLSMFDGLDVWLRWTPSADDLQHVGSLQGCFERSGSRRLHSDEPVDAGCLTVRGDALSQSVQGPQTALQQRSVQPNTSDASLRLLLSLRTRQLSSANGEDAWQAPLLPMQCVHGEGMHCKTLRPHLHRF
jgi:hypothetical protein